MATIKATVHKHQQKEDKTWNVKVHLYHNGRPADNDTAYYVTKSQLTAKFKIKDPYVLGAVNDIVKGYWKSIEKLGREIDRFTARELADYLEKQDSKKLSGGRIDFVRFGEGHLLEVKKRKPRYASLFNTVLNSLKDFAGKETVYTDEITSQFFIAFEKYLKSERTIYRVGKQGQQVKYVKKPLVDNSVQTYMQTVRTLFNAAKENHNDEERNIIAISHNPFKKYKIPEPGYVEKKNLPPNIIIKIRDFPDFDNGKNGKRHGQNRVNLGRDVFMLSFYLMGISIIDLFTVEKIQDGRLVYNRTKTEKNKKDSSAFSVKMPDEALGLLDRYKDPSKKRVFVFYKFYANEQDFTKAVNTGLKRISKSFRLPKLSSYFARHSFANIANNDCGFTIAEVGQALNHESRDHKITRVYVEENFATIDKIQKTVIRTVNF